MGRREPQPASGTARSGHCSSKESTLKDTQRVNLKASETAPNTLQKQLPSQPSEIAFHTLQAEGEPRTGGAPGSTWIRTEAWGAQLGTLSM